jgi:hypothetical protein
MADLITWATYPVPARGFGPHQVFVYMAAVYVNGEALDAVALASPRAATDEAKRLAAHYAELAGART